MSSKTQSVLVCTVMLMSVLVAGFPVMDSSHEMISPIDEMETTSGSSGSSYSGSIVLGADNDQYPGNGMGRIYKSLSNYYSYDYPYWYPYKSGTDYESRPWGVYDLSDLAQYKDITITSGKIHYWKYNRYYIKTLDIYTMSSIPYDRFGSSSEAEGWFNEIGGSGSVKMGSESYTGERDSIREDKWITITSDGITKLNDMMSGKDYDFSMGSKITESTYGTYGYMYMGDIRLELDFTYSDLPDKAQGEIAVGDDLAGYGYSTSKYDYYNYVYMSTSYRGYATWDANLIKNLIPTEGPEGETVTLTGVYLRMNTDYVSGSPTPTVRHMENDPKTAPWSTIYADAGDGTVYYDDPITGSYPYELEWDLGSDALEDFKETLDGTPDFFAVGITSTGYGRLLSLRLVIKWEIDLPPQHTLILGSDNPERAGQAHGYSRKSETSAYCYSYYYTFLYKSSTTDNRGWAVFDLKDVEAWEGVEVKSASLIIHNYYRHYVKEAKFTALETTPYNYIGSSDALKVYTESGPSGTEIGSVSFGSTSDLTNHDFKVDLNADAVNAINAKLASTSTYKTFGIGSYVETIFSGYSYGYARWNDIRLELSFEYDEELQSTELGEGVAFGDDLSGHIYKYTSAYDRPYGYSYLRRLPYYENRAYYQWDVPSIFLAFDQANLSKIAILKVSLRFNHRYSSLASISINQLVYDMKDTSVSDDDKFTDCGDGTVYYSSGSVSSYFNEYEWDLGSDAVADFQNAFSDDGIDYFGVGITTTSTSGYSYDYGPRLVLEWSEKEPPVADAGNNQTVNEGAVVLLDGSGSHSPSGSIVKYEWDFESDGIFDYEETTSTAPDGTFDGITEHTYGDNGIYTVTLKVTDDNGLNATATCVIIVNNVAPSVYLSIPSIIYEGSVIIITANVSDPGSDDLKLSWNFEYGPTIDTTYFNDGISPDPYPSPGGTFPFGILDTVTHTYGDNHIYFLILIVTDDDGGVTTYNITIDVNNLAPTITQIMIPPNIDEGASTMFTAEVSDDGSDDLRLTWEWGDMTPDTASIYFNDGIGPDPFPSPWGTYPFSVTDTPVHTYGDNGVFNLALTIEDDDGGITTYTTGITVNNVAPAVDPLPGLTIDEGQSASFSGHATDPGSDDLTFTWTWGYAGFGDTINTYLNAPPSPDPFPSPEVNPRDVTDPVSRQYGDNGIYTVTLTVWDDDGLSTTVTTTVTVLNIAPVVDPLPVLTIDEGQSASFSGHATDHGSDDLKFTWTWGYAGFGDAINTYLNTPPSPDPFPSPEVNPRDVTDPVSRQYGDNGIYTVTLTVEDDDGLSTTVTTTVTVLNIAPVVDPLPVLTIDEGQSVSFDGHVTDPGSDDLTFTWTWGYAGIPDTVNTYLSAPPSNDPFPSPEVNPMDVTDPVSQTYGDNGIYTVTLTVEDDDGDITIVTTTINVVNVAPTIDPFGPLTADEGLFFDISAIITDVGSDDLIITWELEMGPTVTTTYYNDGMGPDPYPSPLGTLPFTVTDMVSHMYGDDGVYSVDLTVVDDDGGVSTYSTTISIGNIAPEIQRVEAYVLMDYTLRATGEKWHNVQMYVTADGEEIAFAEVVRYPGNPDDQSVTLEDVKCEVTKVIEVTVLYTPLDDPINGQLNGATPVWVNISFEDDTFKLLKHNFNVKQPKNWDWTIYINRLLVGQKITFESDAEDCGSDDLKFSWDWCDGSLCEVTLCCNDGVDPEPFYDPAINDVRTPWGTCPFSATDVKIHTFTKAGNYAIELTVTDDDDGNVGVVIDIILS